MLPHLGRFLAPFEKYHRVFPMAGASPPSDPPSKSNPDLQIPQLHLSEQAYA